MVAGAVTAIFYPKAANQLWKNARVSGSKSDPILALLPEMDCFLVQLNRIYRGIFYLCRIKLCYEK